MRVACDTGRRIEARWLALGGGVGDGEASGVVYGRLCLREISPAVCCVVWLWCSFGRRGVSLASITLGRFVLLVRLLAAALSRVAVAKRRIQFNSIQGKTEKVVPGRIFDNLRGLPPRVVWCSFGVALGGEVLASRL